MRITVKFSLKFQFWHQNFYTQAEKHLHLPVSEPIKGAILF